jgi:hypothetical protein
MELSLMGKKLYRNKKSLFPFFSQLMLSVVLGTLFVNPSVAKNSRLCGDGTRVLERISMFIVSVENQQ